MSPAPDDAPATVALAGWRLKVLVFMSGAVLMGLEMVSSRVLATHFGSSIYVWGSIISVFLAALSLGYMLGGKLADSRPSFFLLNGIVFAAGCWQLVLPFFAHPLCRSLVQSNLGDRLGPLFATTLIFAGPSILIGIVSPFAVRLGAKSVEKMGTTAGQLYALSTIGSIVGTLVTAFWLVPSFGVRAVIMALGSALVAVPFVVLPRSGKIFLFAIPLALIGPATFMQDPPPTVPLREGQTRIYERDTAYHYALVIDEPRYDARWLQFNHYIESGISLKPPYETRAPYTDSFHLAWIFNPKIRRILVIGGGGGIGPRKFVTDDPEAIVDLVEIDPEVVEIMKKYFHIQESNRLRLHAEDGRRFVRRATDKYDLVILDAYTIGGQIPFHLTTQEFVQEIKAILAPGGVLLANINSSLEGKKSRVLRSEAKTFQSVFGTVRVFPRPSELERGAGAVMSVTQSRNVMLVAFDIPGAWDPAQVIKSAGEFIAAGRQPTRTFWDDARVVLGAPLQVDDVPLLTDDYAPVDTMSF